MLTTEPVIEKGIPIPPKVERSERGAWGLFLASMEVGDSFIIPASEKAGARPAKYAAKKRGFELTQRKQPDGSIRVWRVK